MVTHQIFDVTKETQFHVLHSLRLKINSGKRANPMLTPCRQCALYPRSLICDHIGGLRKIINGIIRRF